MVKSNKILIAVLAWYQIAGGALGIIFTIILYASLFSDTAHQPILLSMAATIPALLFYGFSIYCGRTLLSSHVGRGLLLSTALQTIQAVSVSMSGFGFKFVSGILIGFSVDVHSLLFEINLGLSAFTLRLYSGHQDIHIGLDFVAMILIYLIGRMYNQVTMA